MTGWGSVESVIAAIREEARAEGERIDAEAAAAIVRLGEEDARAPAVLADADARIDAARRRAREFAADEDWADRRVSLDAREQWLTRAAELGLERLRTLDAVTRREDLLHLAREAATRVGRAAVEILVGFEDLPLADHQWIADVAASTQATVTLAGSPAITGGCIARGADGRLSYDNTFRTRLRRLDAGWRQALSELFEEPQAVTKQIVPREQAT